MAKSKASKTSAQRVRSIVKSELKKTQDKRWFDYRLTGTLADFSAATILSVFDPTEGDGTSQRNGDVYHQSIQLNYTLSAADNTNQVRIMLVRMRAEDDITAPGSVLDDVTTSAIACISPYRMDPSYKFDVLYDRLHNLDLDQNAQESVVRKMIPVNKKTKWAASGSTFVQGKVFLVAFSDSGAAAHPAVSLHARSKYLDN